MNARNLLSASVLIAAAGCAGHARPGNPPPPSSAQQAAAAPVLPPLSAPALGLALPAPAALLAEPARCAYPTADAGAEYDATTLRCIVSWMKEAQDYVARGGPETKYTNPAAFEDNRKEALLLQGRLDAYLKQTRLDGAAARADRPAAATAAAGPQTSEQAYLEGMVEFQKGNYGKARELWSRALSLDASNEEAKAGLAMLDKLNGL
jgi:tetratricopeptide (TPR) repeat protein